MAIEPKKESTVKAITDYKITDHGVEHSQYFRGAGVAFSKWTAYYTGIGDSPSEALEDALEQLATDGEYGIDSLPKGFDEGLLTCTNDCITPLVARYCKCEPCESKCNLECECFECNEFHCFVTLYVKG